MSTSKFTNQLIHETSPYLRQHAHNPVNWFPWGETALTLARDQTKPIFLSIGYSACHWCHVMERESFENEAIAEILNTHFISIKVDREERPDLDEIYMTAVHLLTQSGGWPLSIWLTPDLKPFYGGTYFPPEDRWGRPGFTRVLEVIVNLWQKERHRIFESSNQITSYIQQYNQVTEGNDAPDFKLWRAFVKTAEQSFDEQHGGFGSAPKFPHAMELSMLLRYYFHTGDKRILEIVEKSLQGMAAGGIHDHLGGGFHRYSTDARWLVPHFEKMLYDNALLARSYLEAYQLTGTIWYANVAHTTLDYVLNEMTSTDGGFYSSQDADTDGEEGKFYTWYKSDLDSILGEDAVLFCDYYGVSDEGNWQGKNILHRRREDHYVANDHHLTRAELKLRLELARTKLYELRSLRPRPFTDDKIIVAWNGLMVIAMVKGYQVLGEGKYLIAAEHAVTFILESMVDGGKLLRTYRTGKSQLNGYLEDYALFVAALLDLYESTFNNYYLEQAVKINDLMLKKFWEPENGGFYFTAKDHEKLLVRVIQPYDNAVPSGNSIAIYNMLRISEITGDNALKIKAENAIRPHTDAVLKSPMGFAALLSSLDYLLGQPKEIVLSGRLDSPSFAKVVSMIHKLYLPNKIIVYADPKIPDNHPYLAKIIPMIAGKQSSDDEVRIYVCENYSCKMPFTTGEQYENFYHSLLKSRTGNI